MQCACIGIDSLDIKTEADIDNINECPYDHKPSIGMFAVCVFFFSVYFANLVCCHQVFA